MFYKIVIYVAKQRRLHYVTTTGNESNVMTKDCIFDDYWNAATYYNGLRWHLNKEDTIFLMAISPRVSEERLIEKSAGSI